MKKIFTVFAIVTVALSSCLNDQNSEQQEAEPTIDSVIVEDVDSLNQDSIDRVSLTSVINNFIDAYNRRDNEKANKLINPDWGIIFIHRPGAMNWFEKKPQIDFKNPVPSFYTYDKADHDYPLLFESLPKFDCGTLSWDKKGLFVDVLNQTKILTPISEELSEYEDVELDPTYKQDIQNAESGSYRVILTTETPLIFHVKEYNDKWYITILDRAYADCSA